MKIQNLNSPRTTDYTDMHEDSKVLRQKDWGCLNRISGLTSTADRQLRIYLQETYLLTYLLAYSMVQSPS